MSKSAEEKKEIGWEQKIENDSNHATRQVKDVEAGAYGMAAGHSVLIVADDRFVNNGDGTVTDTKRHLMWQKGDNGKQMTFNEALKYCKELRLGGYGDWRLPKPEEAETAVAAALMMPRHSSYVYARFDLYWSSDPTILLPFNYQPSRGTEISRAYPAKEDDQAFVKAVRSLGTVN